MFDLSKAERVKKFINNRLWSENPTGFSRWSVNPIFSFAALWFVGKPGPSQKWGFLIGGITQALCFVVAFLPWQPWLFCAIVVYTAGWCRGVKNYWFPRKESHVLELNFEGNQLKHARITRQDGLLLWDSDPNTEDQP